MTDVAGLGQVVVRPTDSIRPAPDNPRRIPARAVEVVAESLRTFGWQQPIVVDSAGTIIVGHTRHRAAVALGLADVPVVVADGLTPEEVRAYRIADNRTGDFASWDFPELAQQLEELADDFADVLALADWQGIVDEYENGEPSGPGPGPSGSGADPLDLPPDPALAAYASEAFAITVVLESEAAARSFAVAAVDMPGVLDVRDRRG